MVHRATSHRASLLFRQRDERADTRRAAGRPEAGYERDEREDGNGCQHDHRIERTDAVQLRSDHAAHCERAHDAAGKAKRHEQHAFVQHQP